METFVILRRNGWRTPGDLQEAAARSTAEGDRTPDDIRWIRSYVLGEGDGRPWLGARAECQPGEQRARPPRRKRTALSVDLCGDLADELQPQHRQSLTPAG